MPRKFAPSDETILQFLQADASQAHSEQEVADMLGISRQAVQQIEAAALKKLRKRMKKGDFMY